MKWFWTRYHSSYPMVILYMLQGSEYRLKDYFAWLHRTSDFRTVITRRKLDLTKKIKMLGAFIILTSVFVVAISFLCISAGGIYTLVGCLLVIGLPWIIAYSVVIPIWLGRVFIQRPAERRMVAQAHQVLSAHPGTKIAIAGSFGKTTAKEVLTTILSEGKKVASTPGNMNTLIGTSRFIQQLDGDEEVIIFELGESHVGDVKELCELVRPDVGIITGINEAHLESFGSLENTVATIYELRDFLGKKPLYVNGESELVASGARGDEHMYSRGGVDNWKVSQVHTSIHGTEFSIQKDETIIWAKSKLIGEHTVGILAASVAIAHAYGLTASQIANGLKNVAPFEHRMQPRELHGAWIIDDTYNGNSQGVEAGLMLLKNLEATRRVYVTPGLVEQGDKTREVHEKIGRQIAESADVVVLMQNSVTDFISDGLREAGFKGRLLVIDKPLEFYTNLDQFVAAGDVVLMQNDWTDNYA